MDTRPECLRRREIPSLISFKIQADLLAAVFCFRFSLSHVWIPQSQPKSSSAVLPRFAAICAGERICDSAFIVARTTLIGLREP